MRLLTHNLLACHAKSCQSTSNNFPLLLKDVQLEIIEAESNPTFIQGFLPKLEWNALVSTARSLGDSSLPDAGPDASQPLNDAGLIAALHHVLLEVSSCLPNNDRYSAPLLILRLCLILPTDSCRGRQHGLPELSACISDS